MRLVEILIQYVGQNYFAHGYDRFQGVKKMRIPMPQVFWVPVANQVETRIPEDVQKMIREANEPKPTPNANVSPNLEHGYDRDKRGGRPKVNVSTKAIRERLMLGFSQVETAKHFGISPKTLRRRLAEERQTK
jgi:hypothetical protein